VPIGFFNVGRGVKTTVKELVEILLKLTGREDLGINFSRRGNTS
jgi:nucleoside-diphosphate-sugar epimerase